MSKQEEPIHQRLNFLIDQLEGGVQRRFALRIGVASGAIGDILGQRKSKPGFEFIGKILTAYPQLRARWLLLGEGEMLKSTEAPNKKFVLSPAGPATAAEEEPAAPYVPRALAARLRVLTVQVDAHNRENIEFVSTRAAAGYAAGGYFEKEFIRHLPSFQLPDAAYRNGSFRCFQVSGDSMQPTLFAGDWVICRYVENMARDIRDNRVYVVVSEESVLVKRVLNRFNERGQLSLQSDNTAYSVQFMDGADVREAWEGVGRLTRQFANPRFDVPDELARHRADIDELFQRIELLEAR